VPILLESADLMLTILLFILLELEALCLSLSVFLKTGTALPLSKNQLLVVSFSKKPLNTKGTSAFYHLLFLVDPGRNSKEFTMLQT